MPPDVLATWVVPLLACPVCWDDLVFHEMEGGPDGVLEHVGVACLERYPVIQGIPRLLVGASRSRLARAHGAWFSEHPSLADLRRAWGAEAGTRGVVEDFDFEWSQFRATDTVDVTNVYEQYFDQVAPDDLARTGTILDAGCGAGRWAYQVASRGPRVIAMDLGLSIEVAAANTVALERVACVQGDLLHLPLRDGSVDAAYCLGVLHHVEDPAPAMRHIARVVRPGGWILIYLYYALDQRGPAFRALFRAVDLARGGTSRLPRPLLMAVAFLIASFVYWPLARVSRGLAAVGFRRLAALLPLSFYSRKSLRFMLNDSVDRFGTRLERRYTRRGIADLMEAAGLSDVRVAATPPYWHATARVHGTR